MCYEFQTSDKQDRHRIDSHKIFKKVQVGIWRVEKEPNKKPCFYADEVMDELLGIDTPMTPEERYAFHRAHIHQEDMEVKDYISLVGTHQNLRSVISAIYYPEPTTLERLKSLRINDGSVNYEAVIHRGHPNECYVMASTNVLRKRSKECVVVTIFMDVSEINLFRDALLMAQHANKAKTMFLNNMSHDIRTPMNAIIGFTSLADSHLDDSEKVKEYLRKILVSSEHLLSLIQMRKKMQIFLQTS